MKSTIENAKTTMNNGKVLYRCTRRTLEAPVVLPVMETGRADSKGRAITYRATVCAFDYQPDDSAHSLIEDPAKFQTPIFAVRLQQCRNGKSFGSSQGERHFDTKEARAEWIASAFEARKAGLAAK